MLRGPAIRTASVFSILLLAGACRTVTGESGEGGATRKSKPAGEAPVCESDADCVMSCVFETDCCRNPCGCDNVRHRETHAAVEAANEAYCKDPAHACQADVGGCDPSYEYATPRCQAGKCVAEPPASRQEP